MVRGSLIEVQDRSIDRVPSTITILNRIDPKDSRRCLVHQSADDLHLFDRSIVRVRVGVADAIHDLHAGTHASKDRMFACHSRRELALACIVERDGDTVPSSHGVGANVIKNWLPFVLGPELAYTIDHDR